MMHLPLHQIIPTHPPTLYDRVVVLPPPRPTASPSPSPAQGGTILSTSRRSNTIHLHPLAHPSLRSHRSVRLGRQYRGWRIHSVHPVQGSNLVFIVVVLPPPRSSGHEEGSDATRSSSSSSSSSTQTQANSGIPDAPSRDKLVLFDLKTASPILELALRNERILNVAVRTDKVALVLRRKLLLYHLNLDARDRAKILTRQGEWETCENGLGLVSMPSDAGATHLAFPGRQAGQVQLVRLDPCPPLNSSNDTSSGRSEEAQGNEGSGAHRPSSTAKHPSSQAPSTATPTPPYRIVHIFLAHTSPLRTVHLSTTGDLLLTSSRKGTLLRVFSTSPASKYVMLKELRRGSDTADTWDAGFADPRRGLQVFGVSDKETVHIWNVGDLTSTTVHQGPSLKKGKMRETHTQDTKPTDKIVMDGRDRALNILKPYLPTYFQSTWSDTLWRIPSNTSLWSISSASALIGSHASPGSGGLAGGAFSLVSPSMFTQALSQGTHSAGRSGVVESTNPGHSQAGVGAREEDGDERDIDDYGRAQQSGHERQSTFKTHYARRTSASTGTDGMTPKSAQMPLGTASQARSGVNEAHTADDDIAKCVFVPPAARMEGQQPSQYSDLIVVTRSGGWFHLSTAPPSEPSDKQPSVGAGGARTSHVEQAKQGRCTLLEYRRIVCRKGGKAQQAPDGQSDSQGADGSEEDDGTYEDDGGYGDIWSDEE